MQQLRFVNSIGEEINFTDGVNFGITEWNGLSECELNIQSQQVPFKDGSVYLDSLLSDRELSFTVALNDKKDLNKRYELKREVISKLNPKLNQGYLYYKNDFLEKRIQVIPQLPIFPTKNYDEGGTLKFSISFIANNPYWEDIDESVFTIVKGINELKITGDVDTEVEFYIEAMGASNLVIENETTGKKLIFPNITNNFKMNLNTGSKSIKKVSKAYTVKDLSALQTIRYIQKIDDLYYIASGYNLLVTRDFINYNTVSDYLEMIYKVDKYYILGSSIFKSAGHFYITVSEDGVNFYRKEVTVTDEQGYAIFCFFSKKIIFTVDGRFCIDENLNTYETTGFAPDRPDGRIEGLTEYGDEIKVYERITTGNYYKYSIYSFDKIEHKFNYYYDFDVNVSDIYMTKFFEDFNYIYILRGISPGLLDLVKINKHTKEKTQLIIDTPEEFKSIYALRAGNIYEESIRILPNGKIWILFSNYSDELESCYIKDIESSGEYWENLKNTIYDDENVIYIDYNDGNIITCNFTENKNIDKISTELISLSDNLISTVSPNSDMDFKLVKGINSIKVTVDSGIVSGTMTYRNKYIGV